MRIVIMTSGSRGDVQPYIALGLGLRRAGYQVCMLTHSIFAQMIEQYGLEFAPLTGNPRAMLETQKGQHFIESGGNALRFIREMMEMGKGQQEAFMKDAWRTLPGADLLLYTSLCFVGSYVAEALHIPAIFAPLQPIIHYQGRLRSYPAYACCRPWSTYPGRGRRGQRGPDHTECADIT